MQKKKKFIEISKKRGIMANNSCIMYYNKTNLIFFTYTFYTLYKK